MDNKHDILALLRRVADGAVEPEDALLELKEAPFEDLGLRPRQPRLRSCLLPC